ncbi:MAG TPA: FtsW/RodA/SpoVE family cell cycle protein [Bryobacteraceae bacterium]|jgi:cell division protein FtsW (lipid II flippase)/cell division protein FtsI/penicillin-binding protein 2|nr:FtsW/RodA/SpoVE family cell cycle protein [Bryobacteraceae bacterium]
MAVTKTWEARTAASIRLAETFEPGERRRETWWLAGVSALVACGLALVLIAKTQEFPDLRSRLDRGELLNLNQVTQPEQLLPVLQVIGDSSQRQAIAERLSSYLQDHRPVGNAGALARIRFGDLPAAPAKFRFPLSRVKPLVVVRTPGDFLHIYLEWTLLYLAAFWLVHAAWRWRRFRGDPAILPALHLLTGIGLILMVSLRDPLRDTLEFQKFAWGVVLGCAVLLLPLLRPFDYRNFSRWVYTPLLAAFVLFVALLRLGSGPTGSDAKVNLGPFQPVEAIKVLIVFFMAGYFARSWERLRDLREKVLVPRWLRWLELPRVSHALPVMCAAGCALGLFFVLKDMGPALVMGFVFLTMFAVARGRAGLALLGVVLLIAGVTIGYHYGAPHTVVERVDMWLSPWNNDVRGGEQLAHALWAFATGGPWGSGPGWGDPSLIPAGHTDLVLPSIGEEWGVPGVAAVCLLFMLLVHRAFRIALRAPDEYGMFLGVGLGTLIALEMLLISGGALGAIPLSGVVSPFLSSGNTAMLANFFIFAVLLGISNQSARADAVVTESESTEDLSPLFRMPVRVASIALAVCAVALVARAVSIEALHDRELLIKDAFVYAQDGVKRPQHNPRLNLLAASIPRGDIYDRNGVLLATSKWLELDKRRAEYQKLGVNIDQCCSPLDSRQYPFGGATLHLLGDWRTGENFHATNASLVEHDSNARLQGYSDYRDLAPVVRYRHQRANPLLEGLLARDRDVHTTIDIRLQLAAAEILKNRLQEVNKKGALVVMNSAGDVLALVSWPAPVSREPANPDELLDRARYGEYPPGSTFKLVTAIAALRLDSKAMQHTYSCRRLGDGRVGAIIPGWRRPVRDDIEDHAHGTLNMAGAITVSCNAYFAQLGVYNVGAKALHDTAESFGISAGDIAGVRQMLPFAAYGQGPVVITPFKMARVAATIAAGGFMPQGRWVTDGSNSRTSAPVALVAPDSATFLANAMRSVVTSGTARTAMSGIDVSVAGKTGTAQLDAGEPHSWFAGFAPYDAPVDKRIAFAVVVEHGGYGAKFAAPVAREVIEAAERLGIVAAAESGR